MIESIIHWTRNKFEELGAETQEDLDREQLVIQEIIRRKKIRDDRKDIRIGK
jgi:hypothetical protein